MPTGVQGIVIYETPPGAVDCDGFPLNRERVVLRGDGAAYVEQLLFDRTGKDSWVTVQCATLHTIDAALVELAIKAGLVEREPETEPSASKNGGAS